MISHPVFLPRVSPAGLALIFLCLTRLSAEPAAIGIGAGAIGLFDADKAPQLSVDYRIAVPSRWLQPRIIAQWATDGSRFVGAGALLHMDLSDRYRVTIGCGPGHYERDRGRDLGSSIEFLSTLEISRAMSAGRRVGVSIGHISNGSISDRNPGTETVRLFWLMPAGR